MNLEASPLVRIHHLLVRRGRPPHSQIALRLEELEIYRGETLAMIGPNGAGKSSLLLVLARLLPWQEGEIWFAGLPLERQNALAYRRKIGLVLQEPLLLNRSVFDNVAAGLRFRGLPTDEVKQRVETWLERLGIVHLGNRPAGQLSAGEAQRASLGRALALQPELLLLDEPFNALDAPTRLRLMEDLHALLQNHSLTTVFVTHDQDEALQLGNRVAVFLEGSLRQVGSPQQVFGAPADEQVAAFVGVETVLPGKVFSSHNGQVMLISNEVPIHAVGAAERGQEVLACLRPEDITLWQAGALPASSARNRLRGCIQRLVQSGPLVRVVVLAGAMPLPDVRASPGQALPGACEEEKMPLTLVAFVTRPSADEMRLAPGVEVTATFKASAVHLIIR